MGSDGAPRRLIVNADDFGRSASINRAVIQAHRQGILTTASLMVNGEAADEAVAMARENPGLGVGLHLSLICGTSALPPDRIPGLVNAAGAFSDSPEATGFRYFFHRSLAPQLESEIAAQFQKFRQNGLRLDHVNGHLHFHLHPTVFKILMRHVREWGIERMRLTRDPFFLNARLAGGRWFYRVSHGIIFTLLARSSRPRFQGNGIRHTAQVFGLLQNALVDSAYLERLIPVLPPGDSELYSHPSLDEFKAEFDALVDPRVKAAVVSRGVKLIRYQDL